MLLLHLQNDNNFFPKAFWTHSWHTSGPAKWQMPLKKWVANIASQYCQPILPFRKLWSCWMPTSGQYHRQTGKHLKQARENQSTHHTFPKQHKTPPLEIINLDSANDITANFHKEYETLFFSYPDKTILHTRDDQVQIICGTPGTWHHLVWPARISLCNLPRVRSLHQPYKHHTWTSALEAGKKKSGIHILWKEWVPGLRDKEDHGIMTQGFWKIMYYFQQFLSGGNQARLLVTPQVVFKTCNFTEGNP